MTARALTLIAISALLVSCSDHSMSRQKRYGTYARAPSLPNDAEAQPLPAGTVAQGDLRRAAQVRQPAEVTPELLSRGRERYDIFCSPCHGFTGNGDGMIAQRGFPQPPSYHTKRLRAADAQHLFDVITNGYGVMYSYAARVEPIDRWAIVSYVRALQQSQHADVAKMPELRSRVP